ncbi:MAG: oligosaccharide repeat unit polymerase [Bacteroidales bacterium]|nr:oligosaccharide repeat unit polymerase [Bacteroidales bacterium]
MQLNIRRDEIHQFIYFWGLILLGVSLPVSNYFMSIALFVLSLNWIAEGNFAGKWHILTNRKSLLAVLSVYLVHVIGLVYSTDYQYAFHDLKIKLPLLVLTIVVGTSGRISVSRLKIILQFFIASVFIATIISTVACIIMNQSVMYDTREISLFISHIRFSLLINMSLFICLYFGLYQTFRTTLKEKIVYLLLAVWFAIFLFILQSFTGIWIFITVLPVLLIHWFVIKKNTWLTISIIIVVLAGFILALTLLYSIIGKFFPSLEISPEKLEEYTVNGNPYHHDLESGLLENGNYIYLYLCEKELRNEWSKKSNIHFDSTDNKGQVLNQTLIRYLTSKSLTKDSAGIASLDQEDIRMIENGYSNYIFKKRFAIYPRIYQFVWELDVYMKTGRSSGHSLAQRIEYIRNGVEIIKRNFWIGVGTGDVKMEYDSQYEASDSRLENKWRLRAHNQFVTFFITFGFIGFTWIIFAFMYAISFEKKWKELLPVLFLVIAFLSMLNEDTLETHAGICFFSFFFSIFIFGFRKRF